MIRAVQRPELVLVTLLSYTKWPDSFAVLNSILDKNGSKIIPFKISFVNIS